MTTTHRANRKTVTGEWKEEEPGTNDSTAHNALMAVLSTTIVRCSHHAGWGFCLLCIHPHDAERQRLCLPTPLPILGPFHLQPALSNNAFGLYLNKSHRQCKKSSNCGNKNNKIKMKNRSHRAYFGCARLKNETKNSLTSPDAMVGRYAQRSAEQVATVSRRGPQYGTAMPVCRCTPVGARAPRLHPQ